MDRPTDRPPDLRPSAVCPASAFPTAELGEYTLGDKAPGEGGGGQRPSGKCTAGVFKALAAGDKPVWKGTQRKETGKKHLAEILVHVGTDSQVSLCNSDNPPGRVSVSKELIFPKQRSRSEGTSGGRLLQPPCLKAGPLSFDMKLWVNVVPLHTQRAVHYDYTGSGLPRRDYTSANPKDSPCHQELTHHTRTGTQLSLQCQCPRTHGSSPRSVRYTASGVTAAWPAEENNCTSRGHYARKPCQRICPETGMNTLPESSVLMVLHKIYRPPGCWREQARKI